VNKVRLGEIRFIKSIKNNKQPDVKKASGKDVKLLDGRNSVDYRNY